jgi:integrase
MYCGERVSRKKREKKQEIKVPEPRQLKSGSWNIDLRKEGESVTEATREACIEKARAIRAGYLKTHKAMPELLLKDAIGKYIDSRRGTVSPSTIATYEKKKRLYFKDLQEKNIYDITEADLQAEIAQMLTRKDPLSAKTVKDSVMFIQSVLAHNGKDLDHKKISLPKVQASPFAVLEPKEITTLLQALPGNPCELEILLALWLGLRRSEILALEKKDFDLERKTVTINKALVRGENKQWVLKGTKTAKSARVIKCPEYIVEMVRKRDDGVLCVHDANYALKCLHRVCEENNLPPIRFHDLRHINASIGLMLGVPDKYMMERGGWAGTDTMKYRYEHTYAAEKEAADSTMNTYFDGLLNCKNTNEITNENEKPSD